MITRRQAVAVIGAAVGSGCLRFAGGNDDDPSPTVTPAATSPTGQPSPEPTTAGRDRDLSSRYPAGLSDDGVEAFLADTHTNALANRPFRTTWTEANVTLGRAYQQRDYRVQGGAAIGEWSHQGPITMYRSSDGGFWREDLGDRVTYGEHRAGFNLDDLTWNHQLRWLFLAGSWEEPTVEREGEPIRFGISATGTDEPAALLEEFEARSLETFEAQGIVDERGVVHSLSAEFQARSRDADRLLTFRLRYSIDSIGQVEVTEPDWLSTAKDRAPDVTADIVDDGQYVEMIFESGNPILPRTNLTLYDQDRQRNAGVRDLENPLEAGQVYYLYLEDESLQVSRGGRPADASPAPLDGNYALWAHRNGAEYFMLPRI